MFTLICLLIMYCELEIKTKTSFDNIDIEGMLGKHFSQPTEVDQCVDKTIFKESFSNVKDMIVFHSETDKVVFLVFNPDKFTLKIHLQTVFTSTDKAEFRELIEKNYGDFIKCLKNQRLRIDIVIARIYVDDGVHLITGRHDSWWKRLGNSLKTDYLSKIYVPVITCLMSFFVGYEMEKIIFNTIVACVAFLVWIIFTNSVAKKKKITYISEI